MSLIAYIPKIAKNRYVHVSFKKERCKIRDFIATGDRPCKDYSTSEVKGMMENFIQAEGIPIKNLNYWIIRLKDYSKEKFGEDVNIDFPNPFFNNKSVKPLKEIETQIANNFSVEKPRLLFYGERGIVNNLFIALCDNKDAFKDFISMIITCGGGKLYDKDINNYLIIIEPDFGKFGFGTPDAVITINNELLIILDAKRCTFEKDKNLTYQIELNYALAKKLCELKVIPKSILAEVPSFTFDTNEKGQKRSRIRKLRINDEHLFFFKDLINCSKFSCLSLTNDKDSQQVMKCYENNNTIDINNLSWIGYNSLYKLIEKYKLNWLNAHLEMSRRKLGRHI